LWPLWLIALADVIASEPTGKAEARSASLFHHVAEGTYHTNSANSSKKSSYLSEVPRG
jgi:1,2-phenylacetyl-CoA epoxidase PaaB subunit